MTEVARPLMVRRAVSFGEAVYEGRALVEEVVAVHVATCPEAYQAISFEEIPILVDPEAGCRKELFPDVLIDAIMAKRNIGTRIGDAPLVIALGPGFTAGLDCHAVIETNRGHHMGRVIWHGSSEPDTGQPGEIGGKTSERLLRAPISGEVEAFAAIGDWVVEGQIVARVGGAAVAAGTSGILRGMIRNGTTVDVGVKIGDVDPRAEVSHCSQVSDKSLAIAGGVLEAILSFQFRRNSIPQDI